MIFYIAFMAYPIVYLFQVSLYDWDPFAGQRFIWFRNYDVMFTADPVFLKSLYNTLVYVILTAGGQTLLGLLACALVVHAVRTRTLYRIVYFLPVVVPLVMSGWLWAWMAAPEIGLINGILQTLGFEQVAFTGNPDTSLPLIAAANNWHWAGFTMAVYLAAYQAIPKELFDSAAVDGAGAVSTFIHITIPQLSTATIINVLLTTAGSFQAFDLPFAMTKGGPNYSSYTLGLYIYEAAFTFYRVGYAATLSVFLFVVILAVSVFYLRIGKLTRLD